MTGEGYHHQEHQLQSAKIRYLIKKIIFFKDNFTHTILKDIISKLYNEHWINKINVGVIHLLRRKVRLKSSQNAFIIFFFIVH